MGQRLVIHIMYGKDELANAYYHYDAFTETARGHVDEIINCYEDNIDTFSSDFDSEPRKDKVMFAVWLLESTGASISTEAAEEFERLFPTGNKVLERSPNHKIIEITTKEMNDSTDSEEGSVIIDLQNQEILFGVYYLADPEELDHEGIIYTYDRVPKIAASDSGADPAVFDSFCDWKQRSGEFFKDLMAGCIFDSDRNAFYRDIA